MADKVGAGYLQGVPQRLLMTTDAVGGIWTYSLNLCSALCKSSEIVLAVLGPEPSAAQMDQAGEIEGLHLVRGGGKLEWMPDFSDEDFEESAAWLATIEKAFCPDIIHLNSFSYGALPWRSPSLTVGHSCVFSWWRAVHGDDPPFEWNSYRSRVEAGLQLTDVIAAPTSWMLSQLVCLYGAPSDRSYVIHNFSPRPQPIDVDVRRNKEPLICAGGRIWDKAKNFQVLDKAAQQLSWPVIAFGETRGPEGSAYSPEHLHLTGTQSQAEVSNWLARASLFVHPAKYEPFGLCVLEAAQHSCALVLADIPSLRELWEGAAVFVSPEDPEQWASALNFFVNRPDLLRDYAQKALRRAARYSESHSVDQYRDLYTRLSASAGREAESVQANL